MPKLIRDGIGRLVGLLRRAAALLDSAVLVHRMAGPHRRGLYLAATVSLGVALVEGTVVAVAVPFITGLLGSGTSLPGFLGGLAEYFRSGTRAEAILRGATLIGAGVILRQALVALGKTLSHRASGQVVTHVRAEVVGNLLDARFSFLDALKTGGPRQVIASESAKVVGACRAIVDLSGSLFALALMLSLAIVLSPLLTAGLILLAVPAVPLKLLFSRRLLRASDANVRAAMRLMDRLNEAILGIRLIKLLNRQQEFKSQIGEASGESERAFRRITALEAWEPVVLQIYGLAAILLLVHAAQNLGLAPLDETVAYFFVLYRTLPVVAECNAAFNRLLATRPGLLQTARLFFLDPALREGTEGRQVPPASAELLRMDDVHFAYGDGPPVLAGASLEVGKGEMVAVVGASGAGKTSIMHLLLGMYAPSSGHIRLDGRDLSEMGLATLRGTVGLVSQDVHLFNDSVLEIIRGGDPGFGQEQVEDAARRAEADGFIRALPKGYGTKVGERGVRLSGGQRQRLLLAQVYARKTPVIILDEATSAVDLVTERQILRHLEAQRKDKIIIVVTHRLANLAGVDRIYVLDAGRIVEDGRWDELMTRRGHFWRMAHQQALDAEPQEAGR